MKNFLRMSLVLATGLNCKFLHAHKDHKQKPAMPAIGVLQGSIKDSTSMKPIEYASVSLVDLEHNELVTGGLSDKNGLVNITEIPLGKYVAVIEFMGYRKKEIGPLNIFPGEGGGIRQNFGEVKMSISSLNMATVDVLGEESTFIQTIDKKIFNVGRDISSSGGNGADVLRKVPSVDVDIDGVVSIAGDANVTILIDGKRSGRTGSGRRGEIENIAASMIEKVEVITNPSAKYDPDGVGGIINIVMKRGALDGFNGNVSAMQGDYKQQNLNGNVNYRTDKLNLFTSMNYRTGDRVGDGLREFQYAYTNRIDSLFQNTSRTSTPNNLGFRIGGDYYPSSNKTIGYTLDISEHKELEQNNINYLINTRDPSELGLKEMEESDDGYHIDHVLSYENKYDAQKQLLKAYASFAREIDDVFETGTMESLNYKSSDSKTLEDNTNITMAVDYENEYGEKLGIETGIKFTIRDFGENLNYLEDKYENDYQEDIYAAYLVTKYNLTDRFGFKLGARFEQVETKANLSGPVTHDSTNIITKIFDNAIAESPFNNPYKKVYPSAFLLYKLTERQSMQFGYSKKVNRPNRRTLSPFPNNTQDISRLRNGNPYLKPEYSDVMELSFSSNSRKLNLNMSSSYKNTSDVIMWWDRDYETFIDTKRPTGPDTTTYEILTAGNAENSKSINFNGNIMYRPMPLASIMIWGYSWNSTISDEGEADFNGNSRGMGFGGRLTLNIPTIARIELSGNGRGKMKITTGSIPSNYRINLGIQKYFLKNRLSVTFKVNDLLILENLFLKSTKVKIRYQETTPAYVCRTSKTET
ncbi:MAG: TonB-dependent receptor [Candidatus Neomarinimicrobiota bacterium]|nr:MAG: TonB-dependent receptor [Candidatus Neomarinimicrobiota bacterium]